MTTGLVFNVQRYSLKDGPGIRTTVFLKGCPLRCWWCHNPESQGREPFVHYDAGKCLGCGECVVACPRGALSLNGQGVATEAAPLGGGVVIDTALCDGVGACAVACPAEARTLVGRSVSVAELLAEVESDRLYYEESGGGVTFSGGEPLLQWRFLLDALTECGRRDLHRAVDTTGFAAPDVLLRVAEQTDLFLYDLKHMDPEVHRQATGVPLQPILDNLVRLVHRGARVEVRIPLIPGVTSDGSMEACADFLAGLRGIGGGAPGVQGVRLLPFHRSAKDKHLKFNLPWLLEQEEDIPASSVQRWTDGFRRRGIHVHEE